MMPEEWPIDVLPVRLGTECTRSAGGSRLSTIRTDFFLNPAERLTEQERALMMAMLQDLVAGIADEILAGVSDVPIAANDHDNGKLLERSMASGLLDEPQLIAILLRRADMERVSSSIQARSGASNFLQGLIAIPDEAISGAAMAVILARGRRRNRLSQPLLDLDDLPLEVASRLAYTIAATIRAGIPDPQLAADADESFARAASSLLDRHEPSRQLEALTADLVRALIGSGRLDQSLLGDAAVNGEVAFLAEALAQSAGIEGDRGWQHVVDGADGKFVLLLRMAGISRDLAARLLAVLGDLIGIVDAGREIVRFETLDDRAVSEARRRLSMPHDYRVALHAYGIAHG